MNDIDQLPREPVGGGGLYDVDPPQDGVTQDRESTVTGDVDALPETMELCDGYVDRHDRTGSRVVGTR
jgi:hypothetical protein